MSLRVGLGASQADLDVQGEIDFDFFEESDTFSNINKTLTKSQENITSHSGNLSSYASGECTEDCNQNSDCDLKEHDPNVSNVLESCSSRNFNKPLITVSCDDKTGVIQKTMIETVIPTPFNYKESKCGKVNPNDSKKGKRLLSPRLKSKIFNDDNEISDDSSISSMSESDSDVSSVSADSFELNESDSMTDISPLLSPYECCTPVPDQQNDTDEKTVSPSNSSKNSKREGVKFTDDVERKECSKCDEIDLHELLKAVKRLEMGQNINSVGQEKISNPSVISQNARCRKNLSFSNEEVRRIDNENQVLLKKIIAQQNRVKSRHSTTTRVLSSSAVNRQRHQRQIEFENLALLRRLESTKPSRDVSRSHLLRDYQQRSSGVLSRTSSRSSKSCSSSSQASCRASAQSSGRSSAVSIKSSSSSTSQSYSLSSANKA